VLDHDVALGVTDFSYLPFGTEPRLLALLSNEVCRLVVAVNFQAAPTTGRDSARRSWGSGTSACWSDTARAQVWIDTTRAGVRIDTARTHVWIGNAWARIWTGDPRPCVWIDSSRSDVCISTGTTSRPDRGIARLHAGRLRGGPLHGTRRRLSRPSRRSGFGRGRRIGSLLLIRLSQYRNQY
jgi:hypothetical protein